MSLSPLILGHHNSFSHVLSMSLYRVPLLSSPHLMQSVLASFLDDTDIFYPFL